MEKLYINDNMLFKDKLPQDLCATIQIIKLYIETGYLNLIHNKDSYQHFNHLTQKRKLDKFYMRCNPQTTKQISQIDIIYI